MPDTSKYLDDVRTQELITEIMRRLRLKADKATTLEGYGIEDTMTETEIKDYVDSRTTSAYHAAGNVAFDDLPTPAKLLWGNVYNVSDAFTTTEDFVEGAGKDYPAGTNVGVVKIGEGDDAEFKLDSFAGFIDLSGYLLRADLVAITSEQLAEMWSDD